MLVFSNQRLGPASELFVGDETASEILRSVADAARPLASAMWEHELVRWLDEQALQAGKSSEVVGGARTIDVGDIAFTPQHFERQRRFLVAAIERACVVSEHSRVLAAWVALIEGYPSDSVQFGRRWIWHSSI